MIGIWLALPLPALLASCAFFFSAIAALLIWLSFGRATGAAAQSLKGVVAPFPNVLAVILAILIGFLASDIWERERRAAAAVREEANQLVALDRLAAVFSLPRDNLDAAIRAYASIVVQKEWPAMARQQELGRCGNRARPDPQGRGRAAAQQSGEGRSRPPDDQHSFGDTRRTKHASRYVPRPFRRRQMAVGSGARGHDSGQRRPCSSRASTPADRRHRGPDHKSHRGHWAFGVTRTTVRAAARNLARADCACP